MRRVSEMTNPSTTQYEASAATIAAYGDTAGSHKAVLVAAQLTASRAATLL